MVDALLPLNATGNPHPPLTSAGAIVSRPSLRFAVVLCSVVLIGLFFLLREDRMALETESSSRSSIADTAAGQPILVESRNLTSLPEEYSESTLKVIDSFSSEPVAGVQILPVGRNGEPSGLDKAMLSDGSGEVPRELLSRKGRYCVRHPEYYGGVYSGGSLLSSDYLILDSRPESVVVTVLDPLGEPVLSASVEIHATEEAPIGRAYKHEVNRDGSQITISLEQMIEYKFVLSAPGCPSHELHVRRESHGGDPDYISICLPMTVVASIRANSEYPLFEVFSMSYPWSNALKLSSVLDAALPFPAWVEEEEGIHWFALELREPREYPVRLSAAFSCKGKSGPSIARELLMRRPQEVTRSEIVDLPSCESSYETVGISFQTSTGERVDPHGGWEITNGTSGPVMLRWARGSEEGRPVNSRLSRVGMGEYTAKLSEGEYTVRSVRWPMQYGCSEFAKTPVVVFDQTDQDVVTVELDANPCAGKLSVEIPSATDSRWYVRILQVGRKSPVKLPCDDRGVLAVGWIPEGTYCLVVEALGFEPLAFDIDIVAGESSVVKVEKDEIVSASDVQDWSHGDALLEDFIYSQR